MIGPITMLFCIAVLSDIAVDLLGVPIPGAAIGLIGLTAYFSVSRGPDQATAKLFDGVAPYFPIFFVPAAAGVIANLDDMKRDWLYVASAVVLGTGATLAVTGLVTQSLVRRWQVSASPGGR